MRYTKADRARAFEVLQRQLKDGDTLHCIVRRVSRSGMSRAISIMHLCPQERGAIHAFHYNWAAAAALGWPMTLSGDGEAVIVKGCGMDVCYHLVSELGATIGRKLKCERL